MGKARFSVGDVLVNNMRSSDGGTLHYRVITAVRPTGYTWEYLDRGMFHTDDDYLSENSSDPFLKVGWLRCLVGARR